MDINTVSCGCRARITRVTDVPLMSTIGCRERVREGTMPLFVIFRQKNPRAVRAQLKTKMYQSCSFLPIFANKITSISGKKNYG